ncbi:MlaE family ABC transporter permease [Brevifollis gellanilyticus]|uniref:Transporter n=1 Tax=Brevifollis gellanilyticus TaxID=748831 RepID=A0A512MED1_9BACT|nr:ABC transporter permease [Brevifollis gellanilyticus]GEP45076.1 transporter [Brevifollis gellanilyticus]
MQRSPSPIRTTLQHLSSVVWLLVDTGKEMGDRMMRGRLPFRFSIFFEQTDRTGVGSIALISLVSFFIGLTMALLTGYQLQTFGQERLVPGLVGISFTRELGPLMTGIMIAARIGAAYTAELGTMTVSEEVEAIEAMGIGPLRFLVGPRVLAVFFLLPCLVVVSNFTAMSGAALISRWAFDIPFTRFIDTALDSMLIRDIIAGTIKSFLFGLIIGLVSCYKGLTVKGGAAGVGNATTSSVVTAITTVIGFDTLCNIVLVALFDT